MKNDRCAIDFEIFLLDILSCKGPKVSQFLWVIIQFCNRIIKLYNRMLMFKHLSKSLKNDSSKNEQKMEELFYLTTFTAKCELVFALTQENA